MLILNFGLLLAADAVRAEVSEFLGNHCLDCHDQDSQTAGIDFSVRLAQPAAVDVAFWERVVRKFPERQMPPPTEPRPTAAEYRAVLSELEASLDALALRAPQPGRTDTLRRLNRTEYQNAIRDLLDVEIDATDLLPADEASHGFDNVTQGELSPTLLSRYVAAALEISRLAVGGVSRTPDGATFRLKADLTQEEHVPGLPHGTRGGALLSYTFPRDGDYEIEVRLARDRNEEVEGLHGSHELVVLLDRAQREQFTVRPPKNGNHSAVDAHLKARMFVTAGPHDLGVTFLKNPTVLLETKRQPYQAHFNMHRHPRLSPAVYQVSITGPYDSQGPGDSPSRRRILANPPASEADEAAAARRILANLTRRAYRRPIEEADLREPLRFYEESRQAGDGFEQGLERAISAVLMNPNFLFRVEKDPEGLAPAAVYRISDVELASRLSFFLWSSIPDDALLEAAAGGQLSQPAVLESHTRRMLADARAAALTTNFASQWLYLRNLNSITPDLRQFPDFDENLRQAFRKETELLFSHVVTADRPLTELIRPDFTFLNERVARHYEIPHVYGSHFRKVDLGPGTQRGGLLRHGSILTVTSYATRTSPVIRGHWILENLLGTPPPPPPANVPALKDNSVAANLSVRERLAEHRRNEACAVCHNLMDPVGFALENYDAVGRWRTWEAGAPVDATGGLPDGSQFDGVAGLEDALLARPELLAGTIAEKMLTFALGRGVDADDAAAVRGIVREAKAEDFRFSALVLAIVRSTPFQMRQAAAGTQVESARVKGEP